MVVSFTKISVQLGSLFTIDLFSKIDFSNGIGSQSNILNVIELSVQTELPNNPRKSFASRLKIYMILIRKSGAINVLGPLYWVFFKILVLFAKLCGVVPDKMK